VLPIVVSAVGAAAILPTASATRVLRVSSPKSAVVSRYARTRAASARRSTAAIILTGRGLPPGMALQRAPLPFETSLPGVFAAGDVRYGSVKRVAGAAGEGTVAVGSVHRYLQDLTERGADGSDA
jgi:NADPH-dependent glutamate synthase beta subunit-like oxidoreductase